MAVKDPIKNRAYVAKSRAKLISRIGIEAYRKKMADSQRAYRARKKALKNANISDRKDREFKVNDLVEVRKELRRSSRNKTTA